MAKSKSKKKVTPKKPQKPQPTLFDNQEIEERELEERAKDSKHNAQIDREFEGDYQSQKKEEEAKAPVNPTTTGPSGDGSTASATPTEGKKRPNPTAPTKPTAASGKPGEGEKRPNPSSSTPGVAQNAGRGSTTAPIKEGKQSPPFGGKKPSTATTQTGASLPKPTGAVSPARPCSLNPTTTPACSPVAAAVRRAWPGESKNGSAKTPPSAKPAPKSYLSLMLEQAVRETEADKSPHVLVKARAGTGKTFTLVVGVVNMFRDRILGLWDQLVDHLGFNPEPSPQQALVWEAMKLSTPYVKNIQFTAFNKSIVEDFESKWSWVCEILAERGINFAFNTLNSLGNTAVSQAFDRPVITTWNVPDIIGELLETDIRQLTRSRPALYTAIESLVDMAKANLVGWSPEVGPASLFNPDTDWWAGQLDALAGHYDIEIEEEDRAQIFRLVPQILERCKTPKGRIDFNDQIWLPVVLNLPITKVDMLLVDEAQDLSRVKQELAKKIGRRLVFVGDDRQAIYSFAGADHDSLPRMLDYLRTTSKGCLELPLTVTRRCGKAIVAEACKYVDDFEAHESNSGGKISYSGYESAVIDGTYRSRVESGDMVLCRLNAPLVSQCFKFLREGRKAMIQGRDMVRGLIRAVDKHWKTDRDGKGPDLFSFQANVSDWLSTELRKENSKKYPNETKIISLQDRAACLSCFAADLSEADIGPIGRCKILQKIEAIFTANPDEVGIKLSSIHKAKGMEAKRVFLLQPKGAKIPHPSAKTAHARIQEYNILYVAITRAIEELCYVS